MNTCKACTMRAAEVICLCHWPLDEFFCMADLAHHMSKTSLGYSHRPMPISILSTVRSQEDFNLLLERQERFEKVKVNLRERIQRANGWRDQLNQICDLSTDNLQNFKASYGQKLEAYCQSLNQQVNAAVQEITVAVETLNLRTNETLVVSCWKYVSNQDARFEPQLTFGENPEAFLMEFQEAANELDKGLQRLSFEMAREIRELRRKVADLEERLGERESILENLQSTQVESIKLLENKQKEMDALEKKANKMKEELKEKTRETRIIAYNKCKVFCCDIGKFLISPLLKANWNSRQPIFAVLCCVPLCVWPLMGFFQCITYLKAREKNHEGGANLGCLLCLLPTCLGPFGAAMNNALSRKKVDWDIAKDLILFFLHFWNSWMIDYATLCNEKEEK